MGLIRALYDNITFRNFTDFDEAQEVPSALTDLKSLANIPMRHHPEIIHHKYLDLYSNINTVFPKVSEQEINRCLKTLAYMAGLKKNLTFHMARRAISSSYLKTNELQKYFLTGNDLETSEPQCFALFCINTKNDFRL